MRHEMIAEVAAPEGEDSASTSASATILAVDDNPASRYVSVRALRDAGFRVLEADCGERAMELLARGPDVVVLDVHLPDISGFEVCRRIKTNPQTARISVLHLSATAVELEDKVEGLAAGADAYLVEPLHPSELVAVVKALLRMRRAEEAARRRAAEAEQARNQLQAVLDAMGEGLCQLDRQGRVVYGNAAAERILGQSAAAMGGCRLHDLVHGDEGAAAQHCALTEAATSPYCVTLRQDYFRQKNGKVIPVEYATDPIVLDGTVTGTVLSFRDITERQRTEAQCLLYLLREGQARRELEAKTAEVQHLNAALEERVRQRTEQLEASNRELEAFTYSVSHDLRAPLRSIAGFAQMLLEIRQRLDPQGRDSVNRLHAASLRMGQLVDALLQLSRVSRAEMRDEEVDLGAVARGIAGDLRRQEPREVQFRIARNLKARGDPWLLQIALENLLGNAWKFTGRRREARIEFGAMRREGEAVFFVRDNGCGFDMAEADKLFVAFRRLHAASDYPGHGIGLATVERIIRRHGGRIWAEAAPDAGATFLFSLPETRSSTAPAPGDGP